MNKEDMVEIVNRLPAIPAGLCLEPRDVYDGRLGRTVFRIVRFTQLNPWNGNQIHLVTLSFIRTDCNVRKIEDLMVQALERTPFRQIFFGLDILTWASELDKFQKRCIDV